jgi:hypothetical protein
MLLTCGLKGVECQEPFSGSSTLPALATLQVAPAGQVSQLVLCGLKLKVPGLLQRVHRSPWALVTSPSQHGRTCGWPGVQGVGGVWGFRV